MNPHAHIPDEPDRNTPDHRRVLYAKQYTTGGLKILGGGQDEWIEANAYLDRDDYR